MAVKTKNKKIEAIEEVFKFKINFKIIKPIVSNFNIIEMQCTEDGHNKYYSLEYSETKSSPTSRSIYAVTVSYGRIGTAYQQKYHKFSNESLAREYISAKRNEKLKKGYKIISASSKATKMRKIK